MWTIFNTEAFENKAVFGHDTMIMIILFVYFY